ncbi:MAG: hypothetical protein LBG71_07230 [Clostridiales Family XIII bacterium]|nr:hypothetical protein [Clostridiales Family XIII bacterium]
MERQRSMTAEIIRPYFTEEQAKESLAKERQFFFGRKKMAWLSSIPLYFPFWLVDVELSMKIVGRQERVPKVCTVMVNGRNNRGLTLRGDLITDHASVSGIFLDNDVRIEDIRETGRLEALAGSRCFINPPPHRVLDKMRLVYYPLALVRLSVNGREEIQVFDYYRGGLDKFMARYLKMRDKMESV